MNNKEKTYIIRVADDELEFRHKKSYKKGK